MVNVLVDETRRETRETGIQREGGRAAVRVSIFSVVPLAEERADNPGNTSTRPTGTLHNRKRFHWHRALAGST